MTHKVKIGDTVALKSGGVAMTVYEVKEDGVVASWFDESGKYDDNGFYPGQITPITRRAIRIDEATIRHVWVFADSGQPISDHIAEAA